MRQRNCSWITTCQLVLGSVLFVAAAALLPAQGPILTVPMAEKKDDFEWIVPPLPNPQAFGPAKVPAPPKKPDEKVEPPNPKAPAVRIDVLPKDIPSADADVGKNDGDLIVPLGEVIKLRSDTGLPIREAYADREKVVKVFAFEKKALVVKAIGVGLGNARVTIVDISGKARIQRIKVTPSLEFLQLLVDHRFPKASLKLYAVADNVIFVDGQVDAQGHVEAVVDFLEKVTNRARIVSNIRLGGVQQIQLQIWIARVDRGSLRKLNSNVLAGKAGNWFFGSQLANLMGVPGINAAATTAAPVLTSDSTAFFGITNETSSIFGFLEALKQQGVVKVLANPMLVTMNGKPAEFLVGGEQPIPTVIFAGGTAQPNVAFKTFGTRLAFLPTLLGDGKIRLDVLPEVSTVNAGAGITAGGVSVPQFVTQRLHTTVEMEAGQTLYLGGLLQNEVTSDTQKFPFLGDLPYVGLPFRRVTHSLRKTELVIVVTPRLMEPLRDCQKPPFLPGQGTRNPTDFELYLEGRIEKEARPPFMASHKQGRWNYSPPTTVLPAPVLSDPSPGPVFGPFGPGMPKPAPNAGPGEAEEQEPRPVAPLTTSRPAPRPAEPRSTNTGFVLTGPINSPLADFLLPAGEVFRRSVPAGR